ncbi:MAG: hypothetical protein COY75_08530 [Nitrospirae bacterium CG_4_10_14_0_8_um_filter_41_23]|nr:DUF86 domain-containing protein [Nitrospirota bacterium]OIP60768.1 MAG: hypothetical protein AUK38_02470 [Nitrospirae bacterium CG2_30_41_42]PIQ94382.1 MAG: hypothetical protein COV68_04690 [Nitrospirae bacterium CG11_big_fil_rev_8_21_14_0_20_41_14]PIV41773.1 MAG: hypothetical protein COS27_08700 [Nitrospirae bacterium CG02_land_8_20_14_3_00_41_53]PIW88263.1 MAG: hypothetical protein COZ94_00635 [Nitrospirae bacterium CG_4_8_14_3_um_filter_41_47]PIY86332.1 MAG: hypothetical protein COY75_08
MYREINIEKIKTLEKDLLDTVSAIKSITAAEEEVFVKEQRDVYSLRYLLIEAVEAMANICNHILARIAGQPPKGYPDCFEKLSGAGIITRELGEKLKKLASLRNIIIHKYWNIDDRKVFKSSKENIGDFEEFLRQINKFIKKKL